MLDAEQVRNSLRRLRGSHARIFGADTHHFLLNEPVAEQEMSTFESQHRIQLPKDYRHFLTTIGNGGAGPFYGLFPLGIMDKGWGLEPWPEGGGIVGELAKPFRLTSKWNDLTAKPADHPQILNDVDYEAKWDQFEERYWDSFLVNGAIPICHLGCALRIWLVVTGKGAGQLWHDGRAEYSGLAPMTRDDGSPLGFDVWYEEWLNRALVDAQLKS